MWVFFVSLKIIKSLFECDKTLLIYLKMSDIRRDHEKSFSISKSSTNNENRNSNDNNERYHRKRTNSTKSNDQFNSQRT